MNFMCSKFRLAFYKTVINDETPEHSLEINIEIGKNSTDF